ncbi:MAG: relaxase/mobilization nuclease domain-containing protein [Dysgonamonadaceae bacterium]|jgi:hypothetical protein|nr:relaxase/mobilization nuclease domain-containing protein [Dysgonamonadaceae bacterium]
MVAKISAGSSIFAALSYNQNKVDDDHARVIFTNKMLDPDNGVYDMSVCLHSFESRLMANQRTEKPILHISLNPDPNDRLTDKQMSDIAEEYMQKMGYGEQPYVVFKHEDIDRHHLHIVSVRVDCEGKKINDKFEHRRSMAACRELEQKYGLVPADQKQREEGLPLKKVNYKDGDVKHQIANVIRSVAKEYHFQSLKEYKALISLYSIGVEEIRGEVRGTKYKGLVYSALNDKGEKVGTPFKSSLFGKSVGIEALEKRIEKSAETIKNKRLKERSKTIIAAAMQGTNKRADFEKALEKQGVSVIFRENEQSRIYGVTFIDHEQKCVFNGSRLGKEFSANFFNDLFNGTGNRPDNTFNPDGKQPFVPFEKHKNDFEENSNSGGIFDFFNFESSVSDEIEEQNLTRRMKKKRKRQRRL